MNFKSNRWWMFLIPAFLFIACRKEIKAPESEPFSAAAKTHGHLKQAKTFSSEVALKWYDMQLRLLRLPPGTPGNIGRMFGYCGVALYESVVPGMPAYQTLAGQLNQMPEMPETHPGLAYHWAASANAALAYMTRNILSAASAANKLSLDSLENALNNEFKTEVNDAIFQRSKEFGTLVGQRIFTWAQGDGILTQFPPYVIPGTLPGAAPGLWVPTPPNFPGAVTPYFGQMRLMVASGHDVPEPEPMPAYSTDPNSAYYKMVKEVYDISQTLTTEQIATANYYRDPGFPPGGHYLALFTQILHSAGFSLDQAALASAKVAIGINDCNIVLYKLKYKYNVERPITFIRNVLGYTTWAGLFNTPGHPDYPSGHSTNSGAWEEMMADIYGENFAFVNHTYDYLGLASRPYDSFAHFAIDVGMSRVYAGIHNIPACEKGRQIGKDVSRNILNELKFLK